MNEDGPVIVVGLDGSPKSWDAFAWAIGEATRGRGSLVAVYVTPDHEPVGSAAMPLGYAAVEQARAEVAEQLREAAQRQARDADVVVTFRRERGDAASTITRIARSVSADLIVVGESDKWLHHLTGSLGRRLVARHDTPAVVVVP